MKKVISILSLGLISWLALAACGSAPEATETLPPEVSLSAEVGEVQGNVDARHTADQNFEVATVGYQVELTGQVRTREDGRARLDFTDGTIVRVSPETVFTLDGVEGEPDNLVKRLSLEAGKLWIILQGGELKVETNSGEASVRGSYMSAEKDPDTGLMRITCLEGTCTLSDGENIVTLGAGEAAYIQTPGEPIETGRMTDEEIQEWLDENPEASLVVDQLLGQIGDFVWDDQNADGHQDVSEPGVPGVPVALYAADGDMVASTLTDAGGFYLFDNVPTGDYYLVFGPFEGYAFTLQDQGSDDGVDSDADPLTGETPVFTLNPGEVNVHWDAGLLQIEVFSGPPPSTMPRTTGPELGDFPEGFNPLTGLPVGNPDLLNYPAINISISNFPVSARPQAGLAFSPLIYEIYIGEGATRFMATFYGGFPRAYTPVTGDCTVREGPFYYENLLLGDRVWHDEDADGIFDIGELGMPGVCVNLLDAVSGELLASTTTDSNGYYGFDVQPDQRVIVSVQLPPGYAFGPQDVGDDNFDSDVDPSSGETGIIEMVSNDYSRDAGLVLLEQPQGFEQAPEESSDGTISLGDYVWFDANGNGVQDQGEYGVSGVEVNLYHWEKGEYVASAVTDYKGAYLFTGLEDGQNYRIDFTPPPGLSFTIQNAGDDDTMDSDADSNGKTATFPVNLGGGSDLNWDAGLVYLGAGGTGGVGPVRSGRLPYKYFTAQFPGSCLVYAGKSAEVEIPRCASVFSNASDSDLNANFLDLTRLENIAAQLPIPLRGLNYSGNKFSYEVPEGGFPASQLIAFYSINNLTQWLYDPLSMAWLRYNDVADQSGEFYPSLDRLTGRQLAFNNVIVMFAEHTVLNSAGTIIDIDLEPGSSGKAVLFRDGIAFPILWTTENGDWEQETGQLRPIKFVDMDGNPFPLHPGNTWVHVMTLASCFTTGPNSLACLKLDEIGPEAWFTRFVAPPIP